MGIKNMYKFIEKYAPEAIKLKSVLEYKNKSMGIDFNLMLYKLIYSLRMNGYDLKNNNVIVTHIHALLLKLIKFQQLNMIPVFVFDGKPPKIKEKEIYKRTKTWNKLAEKYKTATTKEDKKKYYYTKSDITESEINDCKKLISIFGYTIIDAPEEADGQLVQLYKAKLIDYIVSDDMDILLFGGGMLLKKFSVATNKKIQEISLDELKKNVDFTQYELIKFGVLLGSDYCDNIPISINKAYKIVKNNIETNIEKECKHALKYFEKPIYKNINNIHYKNFVDVKELSVFLRGFYFSNEYIEKVINKIKDKL